MKRNNIIAGVGLVLAVVIAADAAYARPIEGTRASVRSACRGELIEGMSTQFGGMTACLQGPVMVACWDNGGCVTNARIAPSGGGTSVTPKPGVFSAPQSLVGSDDDGAGPMVPGNPSPPPEPPVPDYPDIM
jgi:hypothetical protein